MFSCEFSKAFITNSTAWSLLATLLSIHIAILSDSFIFGKATSSQFLRETFFKVSQELLFRSSSFFRADAFFEELLFLNSYFFPAFFPPEYLLVQSETSTQEPNLENRKFFSAVTFQNSYPQKTSTEELLFRRYDVLLHNINFFKRKQDFEKGYFSRKAKFRITYFFRRATFLMLFSSIATFYSSYIFRRASFLQHTFSEELLFHKYPSFPQLHFLLTNH